MKKQPQVIFTNELNLAIFDEYFYKKILERILEIKASWDSDVCLSRYK